MRGASLRLESDVKEPAGDEQSTSSSGEARRAEVEVGREVCTVR